MRDGRARWKVENENNNVLKTKGYHIEHNFGHGSQHLASLLLSLNLLAFLFHTVLDLMDEQYHAIRQAMFSRSCSGALNWIPDDTTPFFAFLLMPDSLRLTAAVAAWIPLPLKFCLRS